MTKSMSKNFPYKKTRKNVFKLSSSYLFSEKSNSSLFLATCLNGPKFIFKFRFYVSPFRTAPKVICHINISSNINIF